MYGHTPNVWRPSEVPYPGQDEDLLSTVGNTETRIDEEICSGWHLFLDSSVKKTASSPSLNDTLCTIPVPQSNPYYLVIAHLTYTTGVTGSYCRVALRDADGRGEFQASTFVPPGTTFRFVFISRFILWGPTGFHQLYTTLMAEGGQGVTYSPPGIWVSAFPGVNVGAYEWTASDDPWDARVVHLHLEGGAGVKGHALTLHRIRAYASSVTAPEPYARITLP